jgi:uncharacterized protein (TIGR02147 family)
MCVISPSEFLLNELSRRKTKNRSYSARAFARDLGLSQPFLTQLLGKKRKLSEEKALQIAERLDLRSSGKNLFVTLARLEVAGGEKSRASLKSEVESLLRKRPDFRVLSQDVFNIVSDWHHFAIIELTKLRGFNFSMARVAKRLKISVQEVEHAVHRLVRVGLLKDEDGKLSKPADRISFGEIPSEAVRRHHRQSLELAYKALEGQPFDKRDYQSLTLAIDSKDLLKAKDMIQNFMREFSARFEKPNPDAVYKMSVQLFRLDKEE